MGAKKNGHLDGMIILKCVEQSGLDSSGYRQGQLARCCEHDNEPSV